MRQVTGRTAILLVLMLSAVSSFGQTRSLWRTAADIRSGVNGSIVGTVVDLDASRRQLWLTADDDRNVRISVTTDSVSTQYTGFGAMGSGQPQVSTGSNGFTNVRLGDRLEVRGVGRASSVIAADQVSLLGRSTPVTSTTTPTTNNSSRIDGVIRQVNASDNRIVIETDRREMITVRTTARTPVYYQNKTYQVSNLEQGDRVSVEPESGSVNDREVRARSIDVTRSIQEGGDTTPTPSVGSVSGKVTRVDANTDTARIDNGRDETRLDLSRAYDAKGRRVRATDLRVGDRVTVSGNYSGQLFMVTTVRFDEDVFDSRNDNDNDRDDDDESDFVTVSISATVVESLEDSPTLLVRDRKSGRTMNVFVIEDFVVKTKSGYTTADRLKAGDSILLKAYRDDDDNLIAQTIRYR